MKRLSLTALVSGSVLLAVTPGFAAPAKTPAGLVQSFFRCVKAQACPTNDVFHDHALQEWTREVEPIIGKKLIIERASLVKKLPSPKDAAKWKRRWGQATKKLAAAGYRRVALRSLGNGKAVVRIAPRVALALAVFDMKMGGRARTEYLLLAMIRQKDGWRIHFIEDSPSKHVKYLVDNKPR